jgi:type IV secretion system protein VirB11
MDTANAVIAADTTNHQQDADEEKQRRNIEKLRNELGAFICAALDNPNVIEIMVNPPEGYIYLDYVKSKMRHTGEKIATSRLKAALGTIAAMLDTKINALCPSIEGELPLDGSRVTGTIFPISEGPGLCIRKHTSIVVPLSCYVEEERISEEHAARLRAAVENRKNILIAGGTGSGKTTFVNALLDVLNDLNPDDRLVVLQDTLELKYGQENVYSLRTDKKSETTMQSLVKISLRLRPDRIIVGEVRGGEALDLLKSWNTGHPGGISTLHSNDALSALIRLEQLTSEVSVSPMKELIGEAVDIVVFLQRQADKGPVVTEVLEVKGVDVKNGVYDCEFH